MLNIICIPACLAKARGGRGGGAGDVVTEAKHPGLEKKTLNSSFPSRQAALNKGCLSTAEY